MRGLRDARLLETGAVSAFILRRLLVAIPVVLLATLMVFLLVTARGDPLRDFRHRPTVSQQTIRNLEHEYHLDESVLERYGLVAGRRGAGRLGPVVPHRPAGVRHGARRRRGTRSCWSARPCSSRRCSALLIGVISAVRQHSAFDYAATGFSYFGFSMPDFFFALLLQLVLVVWLREQFDIQLFYVQGKYSIGEEGNLLNLARSTWCCRCSR